MQQKFVPVILAGGSGTRFWPLSRKGRAKQVLALSGQHTMIQQTWSRLRLLAPAHHFMVITNSDHAQTIAGQLPELIPSGLIEEPIGRNTAAACGLAAAIVARQDPKTVIGTFPSDHWVADTERFVATIREGIDIASEGENMVVFGVPPTRPETGYGYIETSPEPKLIMPVSALGRPVLRFTEKPTRSLAESFLASSRYSWNSGMFLWKASTLLKALETFHPEMMKPLELIASRYGTGSFAGVFAEVYPSLTAISIDVAVLEPQSRQPGVPSHIIEVPANFGWNDLGSWSSLYEHHTELAAPSVEANIVVAKTTLAMDASRNYVYSPDRAVALLGVDDLVVVQTEDAILIMHRSRSQDVGRVVAELSLTDPDLV